MKSINKTAIIEWILAALLIFVIVSESPYLNYYHLSPIKAHEQSERTYYYGPSKIVEDIDLGSVHIYLGKYKDWFSANMVVRRTGIFWRPGSGVGGREIKQEQDITHSWSGSSIKEDYMLMKFYGIVTNPEITEVELDVVEGYDRKEKISKDQIRTFSYELEDHRMFLFHWNGQEHEYRRLSLRGLDQSGNVVYEKDLN
ncbi:DUF5044 domain-containing protein [Virgibacillus sp. L01]|uniref:DUF5044 domain-containing protein n=1 Tax=Virgibacillus sp. L01 TaxID=3457429 RepID=UPI003FCFB054